MSHIAHMEIETIKSRYDAENDVPGPYCHPMVSTTEYRLMTIVEDLLAEIEQLRREVHAHKNHLAYIDQYLPK